MKVLMRVEHMDNPLHNGPATAGLGRVRGTQIYLRMWGGSSRGVEHKCLYFFSHIFGLMSRLSFVKSMVYIQIRFLRVYKLWFTNVAEI